MHLRYKGLDPNDTFVKGQLQDIQANILKGHGRSHVALIFIRWFPSLTVPEKLREWLLSLMITSAAAQLNQIQAFKGKGIRDTVVETVMFSYEGYKAIRVDSTLIPKDPAFRDGMKTASVSRLSERGTDKWEKFYKRQIHCCIQVACSERDMLNNSITDHLHRLDDGFGSSVETTVEYGYVMRDAENEVVEHFGYRDGISQPLFFKDEIEEYLADLQGEMSVFDPSADPFELALVSEIPHIQSYGSYCVFRKLEQDIDGFNRSRQQLALLTGLAENICGALVVGRFEDGTPTSTGHALALSKSQRNNFTFASDPAGRLCPLQSHIRKSNVRIPVDETTRIVRRGISYGGLSELNSRGLLFLCYQADISLQFEKIQGSWLNAPASSEAPAVESGIDALTATSSFTGAKPHLWPTDWPASFKHQRYAFGDVVHLKGGEYFYAPSLPMLRKMATTIVD